MLSKCVSSWTRYAPIPLLMLVCCGLWTPNVQAQTTCAAPCTLTVGQTFTLTATHDGKDTTGYRVYLDGTNVGSDVSLTALSSGAVTVASLVAPARGAHNLQLGAFNLDNETKSDPLPFTTKSPAPSKPGGTQILIAVTVAEDGSLQFKVTGIEPGGGL